MKFSAVTAACVIAFALACHGQPLSAELVHLEQLRGNEDELVEAVRRFDLQQQSLMEWDLELASGYSAEDHNDLAQTKEDDSKRRLGLVQEAWRYVLSLYPNNARANNYYGELLYDYMGDKVAGLQRWQLAAKLDEDLSQAQNNLGIHYFHHGDYERGLVHLGKALDLEPKNPDYLFNTSQIYLNYFPQITQKFKMSKEKLFKEAMEMSRKAAELSPNDFELVQDYATNFYAAQEFGVEADWVKAAEAWRRANALARNDHDRFYTYLNEGRTWIFAHQPANAEPALLNAAKYQPDSRVVKQLLDEVRAGAAPQAEPATP